MRTWLKQFVVPSLSTVLLITIACFATLWARHRGLLRPAEFQIYDRWLRQRPSDAAEKSPGSPVLIVGMNDTDINRFGHPISDRLMNDLLKKLLEAHPAAIGLDVYRNQREDSTDTSAREEFLKIVHDHDFIIVPVKLGDAGDTFVPPPETFELTDVSVASVNITPDVDGVLRRGMLFRDVDRKTAVSIPSLGWSLANVYVQQSFFAPNGADAQDRTSDLFDFTAARIAPYKNGDGPYQGSGFDDAGTQMLLDFRGARTINRVSLADVIDGRVADQQVRNKVILIAMCAFQVKDHIRTPLRPGDETEFGAEYHARVVDQLIRAASGEQVSMRFWSANREIAWTFLFCALGGAVGWSARPPGKLFAGATGVLIAIAGGAIVIAALWFTTKSAFAGNLFIPVVPPAIGFVTSTGLVTLYSAVTGRRDRSAMMQLIGHYVSDDVAKLIWAERDAVFSKGRLRTRRLRGTVLFTDLRGFSTISEQMKAQDLMRWLNQYFQGLSDLVKQSGGIIMKFNGDQIVAVFGPPRRRTHEECSIDARNAVRCAILMRRKLITLNSRWQQQNKPQAQMRVGIHTGWLVAGSLGSRQRMEWTVIGDTVNTAARLESMKKDLMPDDIAANGCRILISDATAKMLDLSFDTRPLGRLPLKGKSRRVLVHGVKGLLSGRRAQQTVTTTPNIPPKKDATC